MPVGKDPSLQVFEQLVLKDVSQLENSQDPIWYNLALQEHGALNNLSKDNSIVIKETDKCGAILALNTKGYNQEIKHQLDDRSHIPINNDPTAHISRLIKITIDEALILGLIDDITAKY